MSSHDFDVEGGRQGNTASLLVDGNMENVLLHAAAQNIIKQGYLPRIVKRAIDRIIEKHGPGYQITDESILEEIKNGSNPGEKLKRPNYACGENQDNEAMPGDPREIQRQNDKMRRLLVCKRCNNADVTHVIIKCGHLICEPCTRMTNACFCGSAVEKRKVQKVKFGNSP